MFKQLNNNLLLRKHPIVAKQLLIPNFVNEGCGGAIGEKKWGGKNKKETKERAFK